MVRVTARILLSDFTHCITLASFWLLVASNLFGAFRAFTVRARLVRAYGLHRRVAILLRSGRPLLQACFENGQQPRLVGPRVPHQRQPLRAAKPPTAPGLLLRRRRRRRRRSRGKRLRLSTFGAFRASGEVERVRVELKLHRPKDHFFVHHALVRLEAAVGQRGPSELGLLRSEVPKLKEREGTKV